MKVTGLVPENGRPATCELCGGAILWALASNGKRYAVDAQLNIAGKVVLYFEVDGLGQPVGDPPVQRLTVAMDHYTGPRWAAHPSTCPKASTWRRLQADRGVL